MKSYVLYGTKDGKERILLETSDAELWVKARVLAQADGYTDFRLLVKDGTGKNMLHKIYYL